VRRWPRRSRRRARWSSPSTSTCAVPTCTPASAWRTPTGSATC
jgi:hypothetical protein